MQPHVELASAVANADRVFWQGLTGSRTRVALDLVNNAPQA